MSIREYVIQTVESLSDADLESVAEYLAFLRFRSRVSPLPSIDQAQIGALYAEFGAEDRRLAEEGMADYAAALEAEDSQ